MSSKVERSDPQLWEREARPHAQRQGRQARPVVGTQSPACGSGVQAARRRYTGRKPKDTSLEQWTEEEWGTKSGRKSLESGERYLPKRAREALSDEEYRATSDKKRRDLERGRQHSRQPLRIAEKTARHRHGETGGSGASPPNPISTKKPGAATCPAAPR